MEYHLTMKDVKKYEILKQVVTKQLKGIQAALLLRYHPVHISRMKHRIINSGGIQGILRPKLPSNRKLPDYLKERIKSLYKNTYFDFNIRHFKDKLEELHRIKLSYETIRQILVSAGIHAPKKKKLVHRRRRRMPKAGLLIQMDSSEHNWLPFIKEKWWLTAAIDDATSKVPFAKLYPSDGVFNNMQAIRKTIEKEGLFAALYADKASHFTTTRYGGLHVKAACEQDDTQVERALQEIGITFIPANSPQAKGRIERLFRTFQDRFIKELRLNNIKNYHQANQFLQNYFIDYYNKRFAKIQGTESAYKPLPLDTKLDLIFCKKYQRKVNFDNTIQVQGTVIQIPPSKYRLSFARCIVDVCLLENNDIHVLYKNQLIHSAKLSKNTKHYKLIKQTETILNQRKYQLCSV
jgi:hypothetical protein